MVYIGRGRKLLSSRKTRRISFPRFSTPSFPFCTLPKTENSEMKPRSALSSLFTELRIFPTPSFPFCTVFKTENSELETSEFSLRFTRTAIFFLNYLIKLRGFPTPSFPLCTTLKTEKSEMENLGV